MKEPDVRIEYGEWNRKNGLRITTITGHGMGNNMYSVDHARILAKKLNEACDKIESERSSFRDMYLEVGKKLGFLSDD